MAEVTYSGGSKPPNGNASLGESIPQTNPPLTEETEMKKAETEAMMPQISATQALTQEMPAPEAFTTADLAMESNPMTTAEAPSVDHSDSNTIHPFAAAATEPTTENSTSSATPVGAEPLSDYSAPMVAAAEADTAADQPDAYGNDSEYPNQRETSALDWLVPPAATPMSKISFDDYLTLSEITFEWGDSYDCKDWMRLGAILAPTLMVDYTEVNGHKWDSMPASDFVGILSHIGFVGDPLVHTQHHIGASKWEKLSSDEVIGHHQLRAAHQRYTNLDLNVVENKGHGHAMVKHYYRKVNGEWKLAGLRPAVRWNEFEFDKIFKGF